MTGESGREISSAWAAAALADVDQSRAAARRQTRWAVGLLAAYGVATVVFFPVAGMLHGRGAELTGAAWTGFLLGVVGYARSQRVVGRRFGRLYLSAAALWTVLWVSATVLGRLAFSDRPTYWVPIGVIVAGPMVAAAVVAAHRAEASTGRDGW